MDASTKDVTDTNDAIELANRLTKLLKKDGLGARIMHYLFGSNQNIQLFQSSLDAMKKKQEQLIRKTEGDVNIFLESEDGKRTLQLAKILGNDNHSLFDAIKKYFTSPPENKAIMFNKIKDEAACIVYSTPNLYSDLENILIKINQLDENLQLMNQFNKVIKTEIINEIDSYCTLSSNSAAKVAVMKAIVLYLNDGDWQKVEGATQLNSGWNDGRLYSQVKNTYNTIKKLKDELWDLKLSQEKPPIVLDSEQQSLVLDKDIQTQVTNILKLVKNFTPNNAHETQWKTEVLECINHINTYGVISERNHVVLKSYIYINGSLAPIENDGGWKIGLGAANKSDSDDVNQSDDAKFIQFKMKLRTYVEAIESRHKELSNNSPPTSTINI